MCLIIHVSIYRLLHIFLILIRGYYVRSQKKKKMLYHFSHMLKKKQYWFLNNEQIQHMLHNCFSMWSIVFYWHWLISQILPYAYQCWCTFTMIGCKTTKNRLTTRRKEPIVLDGHSGEPWKNLRPLKRGSTMLDMILQNHEYGTPSLSNMILQNHGPGTPSLSKIFQIVSFVQSKSNQPWLTWHSFVKY